MNKTKKKLNKKKSIKKSGSRVNKLQNMIRKKIFNNKPDNAITESGLPNIVKNKLFYEKRKQKLIKKIIQDAKNYNIEILYFDNKDLDDLTNLLLLDKNQHPLPKYPNYSLVITHPHFENEQYVYHPYSGELLDISYVLKNGNDEDPTLADIDFLIEGLNNLNRFLNKYGNILYDDNWKEPIPLIFDENSWCYNDEAHKDYIEQKKNIS